MRGVSLTEGEMVKAKLVLILKADDVLVEEIENPELWQKVLAQILAMQVPGSAESVACCRALLWRRCDDREAFAYYRDEDDLIRPPPPPSPLRRGISSPDASVGIGFPAQDVCLSEGNRFRPWSEK